MRSQRGSWLGVCGTWAATLVLAAVVAPTAFAQPSFGPDPFRPYLNQYDPYVFPMGPASPMAGGGEMMMRGGFNGANQFQSYLNEVSGAGRDTSDRAGIGMPYFRSAVNPSWGGSGFRDYQPNARSTPTFEETQRQVSDTYFAYFSERDPKKRAALLKEYRHARRTASRELNSGTPSPSQVLDAVSGNRRGSEAMRRSGPLTEDRAGLILAVRGVRRLGPTTREFIPISATPAPDSVERFLADGRTFAPPRPVESWNVLAPWMISILARPGRVRRPDGVGRTIRPSVLCCRRVLDGNEGRLEATRKRGHLSGSIPPSAFRLRPFSCSSLTLGF